MREEDAAPVTGRAARLLVGEDVLEHAVAADGQVAGGDVGSGGERHQHGQSCDAATPDVGNGEDPKREHRKVEHEQRDEELPVDPPERVDRQPDCEDEDAEHSEGGDPEQDQAAPARTDVELPRPRKQQRKDARDQHRLQSTKGLRGD